MWNLLNPDNSVMQVINKIIDMALLSILWLLLCCSVIEIGPATVALYYAVVKSIRKDRGNPYKEYFHAIKENWKVSLIVGLLLTVFGASVLFYDFPNLIICFTADNHSSAVWAILSVIRILLFSGIFLYIFPLISRFQVTSARAVAIALLLFVRNFPKTLLMLVILLAARWSLTVSPLFMLLLPGALAYLFSFFLEPILRKIALSHNNGENKNVDPWYLE